ncbi:MAG: hypothetical protein JWR72_2676 [Flavisolibacter sp.]|jgi:hypothetical protein|nr:hypothetical protein [Flavisolibacter sp.]
MALQFHQLVKELSNVDLEDICSSWKWRLDPPTSIILISSVGDMFFTDKDGAIFWLNTSLGEVINVAKDSEEFEQLLTDEINVDNWFLATLVEQLILNDQTLKENEVYSFKILPEFGGAYSADNLEATDISVHFTTTGQIHEKLNGLPDGTKSNNSIFGF